jgi:hypothetical protein
MLIQLSALHNWTVAADDDDIGAIADIYYDDERWEARHVVVETGGWLDARRVLLPPSSLRRPHGEIGKLRSSLTREQVAASADVDVDRPVGQVVTPASTVDALTDTGDAATRQSHLRSARELIGYRLQAQDGDAGDVDDVAIDDESWAVHGLVVDARRWWPGGRVLVPPASIAEIDSAGGTVAVRLTREQVKQLPAAE